MGIVSIWVQRSSTEPPADRMDEHVAEAAEIPGTPTARVRRRWLGRGVTALAAVPLLIGTAQALPTTTASAASATASGTGTAAAPAAVTAEGARTASVSIDTLTPTVPDEGDTITVSGHITNKSTSAITDARVALRIGPRLTTRSAIDQAAAREGFAQSTDGAEIDDNGTEEIDDIAAGTSRSFTIEVPVDDLPLDEAGVYQVGVSLTGQTRGNTYEHVLGISRTFLPWQPSAPKERTRLTFLWPLISSTHITARTESQQENQTPVFRDDELAAEIAPGGRLQQLVTLGEDLPVTWVVDPDLLASVEAMTGEYTVRTEDGPARGTAQNHARRWLDDLQRAVRGKEVVALPFGDPDLASLAHRGKNVSGALSHLGPATEVGRTTVETVLHVEPSTDFAWPVEGAVDPSIVSVATSAGARNVITRSDSLEERGGLTYTPTAARPIGGGTTAIVADARLSKMFRGDMTRAENSTGAVQRFLAQTQSITAQRPDKQRSIVVAPQRMPTGSQARAMADALESLQGDDRWVEFAGLSEAAEATPDPQAGRKVPDRGVYPEALSKRELPTEAFEDIRTTQNALDDFEVILSSPDRVETPFGNAIRRAMSSSWRGEKEEAADYRTSMQAYLTGLTQQVRLVQKTEMKLSGRSATIPVTVRNNLLQAVEGLEVQLTSGRRVGLDVGDPQPVKVEGGHSQSVKIPTTAKANGRTWVEAQLYTEDGERWGEPMRFQVEVTEITSAVMLVISGGVLLVVLAGIRMYTQRKRAGERPDPDAPLSSEDDVPGSDAPAGSGSDTAPGQDAGDATGDGTADGNDGNRTGREEQQTGDRHEDTGSGNRGPSGVGEKVER